MLLPFLSSVWCSTTTRFLQTTTLPSISDSIQGRSAFPFSASCHSLQGREITFCIDVFVFLYLFHPDNNIRLLLVILLSPILNTCPNHVSYVSFLLLILLTSVLV